MNVRRTNLGLWALTAALSVAVVACALWGVFAPVAVDEDEVVNAGGGGRPVAATSQASPDAVPSMAAFESIAQMTLRRSLADNAATTPAPETSQGDAPPVASGAGGPFVLVGTIGDSLAMVRTASGLIEIKGVGEQANGARIVAIRPMQVDVEVGGARMTIAKPREGGGG